MFVTYILKSIKTGRRYIGSTNDLERRIEDHNRGKSLSVKNRGPFVVIYKEVFESRQQAIEREKIIKSYKGGEALKRLLSQKPSDPIV